MFTLILILAIVASILLVLIVLIQNPKGGGIAANFSAANQIAGVRKTNDFIEKATWTLAIVLLVCSLASGYLYSDNTEQQSVMQEQLESGAGVNPETVPMGSGGGEVEPTTPDNAGGEQGAGEQGGGAEGGGNGSLPQ